MKAKEEWNASRDELMNKISQAGIILQSEKRKSEMLKLQVTQNEDELNALHTDRLAITQINMETDIEVIEILIMNIHAIDYKLS